MKSDIQHILEVRKLTVGYNQNASFQNILADVNFNIREGEILGLMGASGSGKSLTAKSIIGLLPAGLKVAQGSVMYFPGSEKQVDLFTFSEKQLDTFRQEHIAMIFQNPALSLNPTLKVKKQLSVIAALCDYDSEKQSFGALLSKMGLQDPVRILDAYPHQLSGGQLQRVIIGMTIIKKPTLWIADEPTTDLDPEIRVQILELMHKVLTEFGGSMLYISHDLGSISRMADRVTVIEDGHIIQMGKKEKILEKELKKFKSMPPSQNVMEENMPALPDQLLSIKGLTKSYQQKHQFGFGQGTQINALQDITFTMRKRESLGIIGASGSGKSTLAKLLVGIEAPDGGELTFEKLLLTSLNDREWRHVRRNIQMIHQNPTQSLSPHLSVKVHLEEALALKWGDDKVKIQEKLDQLLNDVGLKKDLLDRFSFQLSGGECQRVCIARSVALEPKLLVCDEITSALDTKTQEQILNLIRHMRKKYDFSLICISHDLAVIRQITDRIILLDDGKIVESATTASFLSAPASERGKKLLHAFATLV